MHSTRYIFTFVLIMTSLVALVLALLSTGLKDIHKKNEAIFNKRAILSTVMKEEASTFEDDKIADVFNQKVKQYAINASGEIVDDAAVQAAGYKGGKAENIDMKKEVKKPVENQLMPLYVYENNGEKNYIVTVRGKGLWDEIWGNIALKSDLNTIVGVSFDHTGETPGLGAEIKDNPNFPKSFENEKIYNDEGEFVSVKVIKGGADPADQHGVDGITGATVTCDGVTAMMYKSIAKYEPYFQKIKGENSKPLGN